MWSEEIVIGSNLVSDVAAASFIPHSAHTPQLLSWLKASSAFYTEVEKSQPMAGVKWKKGIEFRESPQRPWFEDCVRSMEPCNDLRSLGIIEGGEKASKRYNGWKYETFLIEPRFFIPWLRSQLEALNVSFKQAKITSWDDISSKYDVIVNCTALGARILEKDESIKGVGGQIIVSRFTGLDCWVRDKSSSASIAYIYPQRNTVVLGGTSSTELRTDEAKLKSEILDGCVALDSSVASYPLLGVNGHYRPYRPTLRLEIDSKSSTETSKGAILIHNYGYGGEGYCFGPGCATHVLSLVDEALKRSSATYVQKPLAKLQTAKAKL